MNQGCANGIDPEQGALALTAYTSATSDQPQTVTISMSVGDPSAFAIDTGDGLIALDNGPVTLTIPAFMNSASFGLVNLTDVTSAETVQLTLTGINADGSTSTSTFNVDYTPTDFQDPVTNSNIIAVDDPKFPGSPIFYGDNSNDLIIGIESGVTYGNGSVSTGDNWIDARESGNDSIIGASGDDTISAGNGTNIIIGKGGQDLIATGNGDNRIYADEQVDLTTAIFNAQGPTTGGTQGAAIIAGDGNNTIVGGSGDEFIGTGAGTNFVVLGTGNDTFWGGTAMTEVDSDWSCFPVVNNGVITLDTTGIYYNTAQGVETSNDTVFGGSGNDYIWLSAGNNYVNGGGGDDVIAVPVRAGVTDGSNTIFGGSGNDIIFGGNGNDYLDGGDGNDQIIGGGGNNTLLGGAGNDKLFAGFAGPSFATEGNGNNYVVGGSGDVQIFGSGGSDTLIGGNGNDTIHAGDGNEYIYGGNGTDLIYGGAGTDVIDTGDGGTGTNPTQVFAGSGATTIYGGAGIDSIMGRSCNDDLWLEIGIAA